MNEPHTHTCNFTRFEFFNQFYSRYWCCCCCCFIFFSSLLFWKLVEIERCFYGYAEIVYMSLFLRPVAFLFAWQVCAYLVVVYLSPIFRCFCSFCNETGLFFALYKHGVVHEIDRIYLERKKKCNITFSFTFFVVVRTATVKPVDVKGETACLKISNQCVSEWVN